MSDDHLSNPRNNATVENIDRWKRAMDGIARTFVETGVNPAEGILILAKCIAHALQEIPNPSEREQLLGNLVRIIQQIMQDTDNGARKTFIWN